MDESQGPSQLHGHGPWLVCEVALRHLDLILEFIACHKEAKS
jgi:hypothetical protein